MKGNDDKVDLDEKRVAELLGALPRVDAPVNFHSRVQSRIASRKVNAERSSLRPILAGLTAAAVLTVGVYLGYRSVNAPAPVGTQVAQRSDVPVNSAANTFSVPVPDATTSSSPRTEQVLNDNSVAAERKAGEPKGVPPRARGGSIDEALKDVQRPQVNGHNMRGTTDTRGTSQALEVGVRTVLSAIGIDAAWDTAGWRVGSVAAHSAADRSAIKAGDVIEAIDGTELGVETRFKGGFSGRSLRVRRGGTVLHLAIKP